MRAICNRSATTATRPRQRVTRLGCPWVAATSVECHSIQSITGVERVESSRMPSKSRRNFSHTCERCGAEWISTGRFAKCCKGCSTKLAAAAARKRHQSAFAKRTGLVAPSILGLGRGGKSLVICRIHQLKCAVCQRRFVARRKDMRYCSKRCASKAGYERHYARKAGDLHIVAFNCKDCGGSIERLRGLHGEQGPKKYCAPCKRKRERDQSNLGGCRSHRHRARKYGCRIEVVRRISVFERDSWLCKNCGCSTPRTLMGTLHDNAPELDHVIPLSRGGAHSMSNVQCLCRVCNCLKGSMTMDEFSRAVAA